MRSCFSSGTSRKWPRADTPALLTSKPTSSVAAACDHGGQASGCGEIANQRSQFHAALGRYRRGCGIQRLGLDIHQN